MKVLIPPHKKNNTNKPFYNLSLEERKIEMQKALKELEKSTTTIESRRDELRFTRGERW